MFLAISNIALTPTFDHFHFIVMHASIIKPSGKLIGLKRNPIHLVSFEPDEFSEELVKPSSSI
jgi:hypothetical protein